MKKALFLTAFNRPHYLKEALESWKKVRGIEDWRIYAQIEPNDFAEEQRSMIYEAFRDHPSIEVLINPQVYGVLHNPWVGFERLFMAWNYDFVVRAEDDLIVSADILEYFEWAAETFQNEEQVATVNAFTYEQGPSHEVILSEDFSPLVWGTWQDRWEGFLGPTWDHDYSTFNGQPGNQAGWDWNINTRLFPAHQLTAVTPRASRVHNIGVWGVHSLPENYRTSASFQDDHGSPGFDLVDS
jgi:hypothetical protein